MKYYFNGELVRTSKNENYKFYCPETKTCSKTKDGALKDAKYNVNFHKRDLEYYEKALQKLEKGIATKNCITGRNYSVEDLTKYIENTKAIIKHFTNAQVVELEKRA